MSRIVGVLGGMGPEATVDFMARVVAMTPAACDQDHIRMLVDNNPQVPDRQAALTGDGEDPGPALAGMARKLEAQGAEFLVMPCNTAHAWAPQIRSAVRIPLLSIVDATVAACAGAERVGLLSTAGCLASRVYQDGLAAGGKELVLSTPDELAEVQDLVFRVKAGDKGPEVCERMAALANALVSRGGDIVVAACTEIPLVLHQSKVDARLVKSTEVLAAATVAQATA